MNSVLRGVALTFFLSFIFSCQTGRDTGRVTSEPNPFMTKGFDDLYERIFRAKADTVCQIDDPVRYLFEDRKGLLWIGTGSRGLVRFDGKNFRYFTQQDGLPGMMVNSITEDYSGNLWLATDKGICRFDGRQFTVMKKKTDAFFVTSVFRDREGVIWAGSFEGLYRFDGKDFKAVALPGYPRLSIRCITGDSKGRMWLGTDQAGAFRMENNRFVRLSKEDGLCSNQVTGITEDAEGRLWFSSVFCGISRYDGRKLERMSGPNLMGGADSWTTVSDRSGNLWLGSDRTGLYRFDGKSYIRFGPKQGLAVFAVQTILEDRQGRIWAGGGNGLYRYNGQAFARMTRKGPRV